MAGAGHHQLPTMSSGRNLQRKLYRYHHDGGDAEEEDNIDIYQFHRLLRSHPLLRQFLELEDKILRLNPYQKDPLKPVLKDIESLGLNILGLPPHDSSYTTIVTEALEVFKEQREGWMQNHSAIDESGVVKVDPKPRRGFIARLINRSVKKVAQFLPFEDDKETSMFLTGGFAPVTEETSPTMVLRVKGQIPGDLKGMMIRNGPNPIAEPLAKYTLLDGDGMLHGVRFEEGKATYVSRYVKTSKYKQEELFDQSEFMKIGDLKGPFGLYMACVQLLKAKYGVLDLSYGWLRANTALVYHAGMLMAVEDHDKPYVINVKEDGDIQTLGINHYYKGLTHDFLPHPKKDLNTGEMFLISASYTSPYTIYNVVSKDGRLSSPVPITTSGPTYMHDFGITDRYAIFMDLPYYYDPEKMVKDGRGLWTMENNKKSRFGVLPKYAKSEVGIRWFEFQKSLFIFHNGNSWEEDEDTIILISCLMKPKITTRPKVKSNEQSERSTGPEVEEETSCYFTPAFMYTGPSPSVARARRMARMSTLSAMMLTNSDDTVDDEPSDSDGEVTRARLYKLKFNMRTGACGRKKISDTFVEYPRVNESYKGRKTRYVYANEMNEESKVPSIIKFDLHWNREVKLNLGKNKYGSEAIFVSRQGAPHGIQEDDGYLTTFVYDEKRGKSSVYVIGALRMEPFCKVELPTRVPYGFHAIFLTEEELEDQVYA